MRNEATSETSCETCMWPAALISGAWSAAVFGQGQSENYTNEQFFVAAWTNWFLYLVFPFFFFLFSRGHSSRKVLSCFDADEKLKRRVVERGTRWLQVFKICTKIPCLPRLFPFLFLFLFFSLFFRWTKNANCRDLKFANSEQEKSLPSRLCPAARSQDFIFPLANIIPP